jgi:hypothetical protein
VSNITNNRVSATIDAATIQKVKDAIASVHQMLPFLIGLKPEERQAIPKINDVNKSFTSDAITAIKNNGTLLPAYLSVTEIDNDFTLFQQLDELVQLSSQLTEKLSDTQMMAGSEAYVSALTAYRLFEAASNAGVAGTDTIYDQLKQRFAGQGGSGTVTPTLTNPA